MSETPEEVERVGRAVVEAWSNDLANAPPQDMVWVLGCAALDAYMGPISPELATELSEFHRGWSAPAREDVDALQRAAEAISPFLSDADLAVGAHLQAAAHMLRAIRVPTFAMAEAGSACTRGDTNECYPEDARQIFIAMIDAALASPAIRAL